MTDGLPSTVPTAQRLSEALVRVGTDRMITRLGLCRNVLKDVFPADPMVVSLLAAAVEHGSAADLVRDGMSVDAELLAPRVADDLARAGGFSAERASWAVRVWASALGIHGADRTPYRPVDPTGPPQNPPPLAADRPTTAAVWSPSTAPTAPRKSLPEPPPGPRSDPSDMQPPVPPPATSPEPSQPGWHRPAVVAAAVVAVAALAAVLAVAIVKNGKPTPAAQPTVTRTCSNGALVLGTMDCPSSSDAGPSATGGATQGPSGVSTDSGGSTVLSSSEQTLVDRLPPTLVDIPSCTSNASSEDATYTLAAVTCKPNPRLPAVDLPAATPRYISAFQDRSPTLLQADLDKSYGTVAALGNDCLRPPAAGTWKLETGPSGTTYCLAGASNDDLSYFAWTYPSDAIALVAGSASNVPSPAREWFFGLTATDLTLRS